MKRKYASNLERFFYYKITFVLIKERYNYITHKHRVIEIVENAPLANANKRRYVSPQARQTLRFA